jgi:hypothetical protein
MAKNKTVVCCLFWIIACFGLLGQNAKLIKTTSIYRSQIGVRESTGHNDGARVESYLKVTGLGKGNAWCAAFVAWTYQQAGVDALTSAWSPNWFPASNTIYTRGSASNQTPSQADVFGIFFEAKKRIAHVGFIDEWQPDKPYTITVEGNTNEAGSREGDGVYRKRRLKSQIYKVSRWIK